VQLQCMDGSQELLYGASSFITLPSFAAKSPYFEKSFLTCWTSLVWQFSGMVDIQTS
jgi:hypothetical protein